MTLGTCLFLAQRRLPCVVPLLAEISPRNYGCRRSDEIMPWLLVAGGGNTGLCGAVLGAGEG